MTVAELLDTHPGAMGAFIERRMLCVGCPAEAYHTLEEVALIYGCGIDDLRDAILEAIGRGESRQDAETGKTGFR